MTEVDGFEMLRRIRKSSHQQSARILAIMGDDATQERRRQVAAAGSDGFIAKPFTLVSLNEAIQHSHAE